jgi:hypothetical protein
MNTINELAARLASLCNDHKFVDAYTELFADEAVSIDPIYKNEPLTGLPGLIEREKQFLSVSKVHAVKVSDAIYAGSYFSVIIAMDFTAADGSHKVIEELAVYKVEKGKIVSQQFFIG